MNLSTIKLALSCLSLGLLIGIVMGWTIGRSSSRVTETKVVRERKLLTEPSASETARFRQENYAWYPKDTDAFLRPRTSEHRAEIRRLVRSGIEQKQFPARMKAVADLLAMMTPENAHEIRDGFEESWNAGYNFDWERSLFFARYGEVMGAEGAEEFIDHPQFGRLMVSWAQAKPSDAVAWANMLPDGSTREKVINRIMFGVAQLDTDYGLEIFEVLHPEDQVRNRRYLVDAFQRAGGAKGTDRLANELLSREEERLKDIGRYALTRTFSTLKEGDPDRFMEWLKELPSEHLGFLDPEELPEEFLAEPEESR